MSDIKLPIGIQSFQEIRTKGYVYVDKTPFISSLVESGKYYFLSRPRRFGKSLFMDTIDCAFSGKKELFNDLFLGSSDSGWDFSNIYPVLKIDFSGGTIRSADDLNSRLDRLISSWEEYYGTQKTKGSPGERLLYLIPKISEITGNQVVILVDEYDKPILDNLEEQGLVIKFREMLKDFYSAIKPLDPYLKFVFLTGVSKFAKTGVFSGLNNLDDITIDSMYSAICGYTEDDLKKVFGRWILNCNPERVREWYNGYSWTGETVYNPFDILLLFSKGVFRPYWFETGTPTFLINLWKSDPRLPADYDGMSAGDEMLGSFDPEQIRLETLLFQSGYLTIKKWYEDPVRGVRYVLGYPNTEVRTSLNILFSEVLGGRDNASKREHLYEIISAGDISGLRVLLNSLFASIPHDWYRKNQISRFEGYYASVIYSYLASTGFQIVAEDSTNRGRIDLTLKTTTAVWIFEFKVRGMDKDDINPLLQIKQKGYANKYSGEGIPIYLIGILFDPDKKNIVKWEIEIE
jgi:hypothetical protein